MDIAITVLAGGRSSRFGRDKRFFNLSGKSLIRIAIEKAESLNLKTYLSVDKNFPISFNKSISKDCNLIVDDYPYKGPLAAMVSTLRKIEEEKAIFIPVDMPYIPVEFLTFIRERAQDYEVIYSIISEKTYSLPSLVSKAVLEEIENLVESDALSLKRSFKSVSKRCKTYVIDDKTILRFGDPRSIFHNINCAEDLRYFP